MDLAYTVNCQRDDGLRESYYAYTREVFGFDLKAWQGGMFAAGDALGDADPFRFPVTAQT